MLIEDQRWLVLQTGRPVSEFLKVAKKIDLREKDWSKFWEEVNVALDGVDVEEEKYLCQINGEEKELTEQEFEYVKFMLGDPEEASNCCGGRVEHGVCQECYEHCQLIYVFS